jgi:RNA polymerase sigma-B factor
MVSPHRTTAARAIFDEFADTRDPSLREKLVEAHLGIAHHLAGRFSNRGESHDDLVQVASIALIHAIDRFDPSLGFEFSTFATRTVLGELKRHFRDKGWSVRAPRRIQELYLELGAAAEELAQELGHPPNVPPLAARTSSSEEDVLEALEAGQAYRATSIDAPDHQYGTIASRLGGIDTGFENADDRQVLVAALETLPERERHILKLRFIEGMTQSQIAEQIGVSQMHVSRLLSASIAHLRKSFVPEL